MPYLSCTASGMLQLQTGAKPFNIRQYMSEAVQENTLLEAQLLLLTFVTGMQDAASYSTYGCFASNQTGNTLYLAMAALKVGPVRQSIRNFSASLGFFLAGALILGQIGNYFGPRRRAWLLSTNIVQTLLTAAAVGVEYVSTGEHSQAAAVLGVSLLAFSSGGQVAMGRSLGITEITTAIATAAYVDIMVDPRMLSASNRKRNRRVAFVLLLVGGCFIGAVADRWMNSAFVLLLCLIGKGLATVSFIANQPISDQI